MTRTVRALEVRNPVPWEHCNASERVLFLPFAISRLVILACSLSFLETNSTSVRAVGTLPFGGESSGVIFKAILDAAPTPALRLNPDLPPKLEDIINKCLEKDRNLRYQHASDIRTDLQRLKRDTETGRVAAASSGTVSASTERGHRRILAAIKRQDAESAKAAIGATLKTSKRSFSTSFDRRGFSAVGRLFAILNGRFFGWDSSSKISQRFAPAALSIFEADASPSSYMRTSWTRRFFARPSSVELLVTGRDSP
jgi:serine/threonine protein kinase